MEREKQLHKDSSRLAKIMIGGIGLLLGTLALYFPIVPCLQGQVVSMLGAILITTLTFLVLYQTAFLIYLLFKNKALIEISGDVKIGFTKKE